MLKPPRYVLALDESGQTHIRNHGDGRRHGFIEGGLVVRSDRATELCERIAGLSQGFNIEVKSNDFATAVGGIGSVSDYERALAHVTTAFHSCNAILAGAFLTKDAFDAPPDGVLVARTRRGGTRINQKQLFSIVALSFGDFVRRNGTRGEIIHDHLTSGKSESEFREELEIFS